MTRVQPRSGDRRARPVAVATAWVAVLGALAAAVARAAALAPTRRGVLVTLLAGLVGATTGAGLLPAARRPGGERALTLTGAAIPAWGAGQLPVAPALASAGQLVFPTTS